MYLAINCIDKDYFYFKSNIFERVRKAFKEIFIRQNDDK